MSTELLGTCRGFK